MITLLTDFGDYYPGVMKGVIMSIANVPVVDITHNVEPQNVYQGAFLLYHAYRYFKNAIHVAVVDPGVGSERRALAVLTRNHVFIGPDNGILYPSASQDGIVSIHEIDPSISEFVGELSATFHGRDIFAPAAALAAKGELLNFCREVGEMQELNLYDYAVLGDRIVCKVVFIDRFGNLITNVRAEDAKGKAFYLKDVEFPLVRTYSDVDVGRPLALIGSFNTLELSLREGNASEMVGIRKGNVEIELEVVR